MTYLTPNADRTAWIVPFHDVREITADDGFRVFHIYTNNARELSDEYFSLEAAKKRTAELNERAEEEGTELKRELDQQAIAAWNDPEHNEPPRMTVRWHPLWTADCE